MHLYDVILNNARFHKILTYSSPSVFAEGDLIEVPLKGKTTKACIVKKRPDQESRDKPSYKIQNIKRRIYSNLDIPEREMLFLKWMSRYYHYPLGKLIFDILPRDLKRPREFSGIVAKETVFQNLNSYQRSIYRELRPKMNGPFSKALIHGITGSGKTRIYKSLMKDILQQGKSILFLLPEINLTPQFLEDFKKSFDCILYHYTSGLPESNRYGVWKALQNCHRPSVVIGVRSSLFLPMADLGLIVVDEEHDSSFKQEDRCPYNARDMAIKKASIYDIPVVLGSATPSLETFHAFKIKKEGGYFYLDKRVQNTALPKIILIDEKSRSSEEKKIFPFKEESLEGLKEAIDTGEKAIVFINRLGYFSLLQCRFCGHTFECPNCSIGLKFYKSDFSLRCNHCFHRESALEFCPKCGCIDLFQQKFGTEKVEEVLKQKFPSKNIVRFDRDRIKNLKELNLIIEQFQQGCIDILVGTQMISKGHNFKGVNTIVVLGTDSLLNFPDFRANERVYQTLVQVSGRCGRFGKKGRVYVQTMNPKHSLYEIVKKESTDKFYKSEISLRELCGAPPFKKICLISLTSSDKGRLETECKKVKKILDSLTIDIFQQTRVLGPTSAFIEKRAGCYTWFFLVNSSCINELHNCIHSLSLSYTPKSSTAVKFDIDPSAIF